MDQGLGPFMKFPINEERLQESVQENLQALLELQYSVNLPPILTTRPRDRKKNEKIETDSFDREQTELEEFYNFQAEIE